MPSSKPENFDLATPFTFEESLRVIALTDPPAKKPNRLNKEGRIFKFGYMAAKAEEEGALGTERPLLYWLSLHIEALAEYMDILKEERRK